MNMKNKGSGVATRLKDVMRVSVLLSSEGKTSGHPPVIHPPWNKARIRPVEEGERRKGRLEERKGGGIGRGLERGEAGKTGGEIGSGLTNIDMRNAVEKGESVRPEHRGELPGSSSTGHFASQDGGMFIDGSYFQTSIEVRKPPVVKQKLSETLSLISLARRLQGPARVGDEQWSSRESWDIGEENGRKMYGSVGDMSVSSSVSERARREERRRRKETQAGWECSSPEWLKGEKRFHDGISERGSSSKESLSAASSQTSSVTAKHGETSSDTETEKNESDSGTDNDEGPPDTETESAMSESEGESGLESEDEGTELSRNPSKCGIGKNTASSKSSSSVRRSSSAKVKREGSHHSSNNAKTGRTSSSDSDRKTNSTVSRSGPHTSRHSGSLQETIEEEGQEDEDSGEEEAKGTQKLSRRATNSDQSDIGSGVIDVSGDLSTIIEDTEEEERSSGRGGDRGEDEEEGDLENELVD